MLKISVVVTRRAVTVLFRRRSLNLICYLFHADAADASLCRVFEWDGNVCVSAAFCFTSKKNNHYPDTAPDVIWIAIQFHVYVVPVASDTLRTVIVKPVEDTEPTATT